MKQMQRRKRKPAGRQCWEGKVVLPTQGCSNPAFFFSPLLNSWFLIGRCCLGSRLQPQSPGPVSGRVEARSATQHPRSAAHPAPGGEERAFCPRKAAPLSRYQERCPQRSLATDLAGEMGSGFGIRIQHLGTE